MEPETYRCVSGWVYLSQLISGPNPVLLTQADAATTAQRVVIKGTLVVDISTSSGGYTFFDNSEIVFAEDNNYSGIIINPNCKLTLDKVSVHGCTTMWGKIEAQANSTLVVKNGCHFKDGSIALFINGNATVSITDSRFDANHISMAFQGPSNGPEQLVNFTQGGGIWGNTIDGSSPLKHPNLVSQRGINAFNVNLQLGSLAENSNTIINFPTSSPSWGLFIASSTVRIQNVFVSGFRSITSSGIHVLSSSLTLIGSGTSITIEDCSTGIEISDSDAEIRLTKIVDTDNGIRFYSWLSPRSLKVKNSVFDNFMLNGIDAGQIPALFAANFEVDNCIFDDNSPVSLGLYNRRKAIRVEPGQPSQGNGFKFKNNKMFSRNRGNTPGYFGFIGVSLSNIYGGGVGQENEFYDENAEPVQFPNSARDFEGVRMQGCNGFKWSSNDLVGVGSQYWEHGFRLSESPNCNLSCNHIDNLGVGASFDGICNTTTLYQNSFNNHDKYGLWLATDGTVIGGQFKKYNTWGGTPGVAEAYMTFPNYDPFLQSHEFQVKKSLFTPQTNNQNTGFWADPRRVGAIIGNDPHWFVGPATPTPPSINLCPAETIDPEDPRLDFGEKSIVDGTFIPWQGYAANTWDAALLLYQRMQEDSSLRPSGTPEAIWYANNYYGNLGKLWRVYDGFVSLSTDPPLTSASQLLSDLNAIVLTTTHEQNLKTDLRIFLEMNIANSDTMTQAQTDLLNDIADQCRYEGGIGVVLARLALGQSSRREGDCSEGLRGTVGTNQGSQASIKGLNVSVFPNPAGQSFSVRLDQNVQNGTLRLVNLQGQITRTWEFSGNTADIQDANVNPGVYFLEVQEQGAILSRNKVVFNR